MIIEMFLDLRKDIDYVSNSILFGKLYSYHKIRGTVYGWFTNHVTNMHQYVQLNGSS